MERKSQFFSITWLLKRVPACKPFHWKSIHTIASIVAMTALATTFKVIRYLSRPWYFIALSITYIPSTILSILISGNARKLVSLSEFSNDLWANFWTAMGPKAKIGAEKSVIALLKGKVSGGRVHDAVVSVPLHGNILEVGAGSGLWVDVFAQIHAANIENKIREENVPPCSKSKCSVGVKESSKDITKIYGIEPNPIAAKSLRERVKQVGLASVYEVIPAGIEDVTASEAWRGKIATASVDCIVTVWCLCSIPDLQENVELLYTLLKPGGSWYVFEHVKASRGAPLISLYQRK